MAYTPTVWVTGDKVTSAKLNKIENGIADKVDKVSGKTLSTNDYTNADKKKVDDISISSPTNGQALVYNSSTQKWENKTISGGGSGSDGYSPTITVTNITGGHRVAITDVDGIKTFDVMDGTDGTNGTNGTNGFSPTVTVANITGGHRVSITDATGTKTFDVMDGTSSEGGTTTEVYYVTPEDYGAVGDGSTDDTNAISQAFNSGMPVVLTQGKTYKIDTVTVTSPLIIIGNFATISTTSSDSVKSTIIIRENAKTVVIGDVNFTTTLGIDTTGAHGEAISNRSLRTCIASYGVEKLSVINCNFDNFDNGIIGITQSTDTEYASVPEYLYVKDTNITNCLMGISRHYKNVVIDGCSIRVDTNAQSGEHCIYLLSDVLSDTYITNTTLITDGSSAGACVNIRPRTGEAGANLVDGVYRIDGCTMIGDGYVHVHGGGKCYVTSCTLKTINYNTTAKMRQFACPSSDDSIIDVTGCSVNLELQDGITERIVYRGCDIYSNGMFSTRFAVFKAYDCQFDNIGINVAEGAEIVGCVFSSTSGVAGKYYVLVGSTITASTIIGCMFKTGTDVNMIAYNSSGVCLLVAVISSLPNGNNNTGLTFYHKIDPTQPESGSGTDGFSPVVTVTDITGGHRVTITDATGGKTFDVMDGTGGDTYSPWSDKKVCVFGDSIGYGYNNNAHSFVDILSERNVFASVHKNCVSGSTTATLTARLQESATEVASADIIYCEYEANDIVGLKGGSLTTDALVSTVRNCTSAIRNANPTCTIIWMPLTIQHLSKIAGTDLSYYQSWVNAMYPVFSELGINMLPIFDTLNANHASSDGRHPNDAGHEAIADLIMQMPLGTSNYPTSLS